MDNRALMNFSAPSKTSPLVISIVSHGHGAMVQALLWALASCASLSAARVVLTLNVPEAEPAAPPQGWPFVLQLRRNTSAAGFGANHNRALTGAQEAVVCVLNPDVVLLPGSDPFLALLQTAAGRGVGCAYPRQVDAAGQLQDSERGLPTPAALWRRWALRAPEQGRVDWVNGACMVLPRAAWEAVAGFDERYFMYCEDVDLCLRLRLLGWSLALAPTTVQHAGRRASRSAWRPLWWHVRSMARLWRSQAFWRARRLLAREAATSGAMDHP